MPSDNESILELPEVASWVGITQGMNNVNFHTVLYSMAEQNMVNFVKCILLFRL